MAAKLLLLQSMQGEPVWFVFSLFMTFLGAADMGLKSLGDSMCTRFFGNISREKGAIWLEAPNF